MDNLAADSYSGPDLLSAKRVLCIQPHYDDNDLCAGGTIAELSDRGANVFYLTVTDDLVGVLDQTLTDAQMAARLRAEQEKAGEIIGVREQHWLGYPDAGPYDYYRLRGDILRFIRRLRPDFVITADPWLPYEVHQDHIRTGFAASEAVFLAGFPRLKTEPEFDRGYDAREIQGIAYYTSAWPNRVIDIGRTAGRKHEAMLAYRAQFSQSGLEALVAETSRLEREAAEGQAFSHAEKMKVIRPAQLHSSTRTWQS